MFNFSIVNIDRKIQKKLRALTRLDRRHLEGSVVS
jgi:hypothetical protein